MREKQQGYETGDWLIHVAYGIGQVVGIEEKILYSEKKRFYRVKAQDNGVFWIPIDLAVDNERVRPIAQEQRLAEALKILRRAPRSMSTENNVRKKRIHEARAAGRLLPIARLVRDLTALKSEKKLTMVESNALEYFKNRLVAEWATCMEITPTEANRRLAMFLEESQAKPPRPIVQETL